MRSLSLHIVARATALVALSALPAYAQVAGKIAVYPASSSVEVTGAKQFSAYVPITPNTVVWLVNGVVGGNATLGTVTAAGLYRPPAVIPSNNVLTIAARSTKYPSSIGTATLTVTRPYPWLWNISQSSVPVGAYSITFNGANFATDSQALANGVAVQTTFVSSTKLVASGATTRTGTIQFAVRQPAPGAVTGNTISASVTAVTVSVVVAPATSTLELESALTFAATVTGNTNTAVTWSVNGTTGGSAVAGFISTAGVYATPAAMPVSPTVQIRATSVASPSSYGQASVNLVAPPKVTVSPTSATVLLGAMQTFSATITGGTSTSVTWSVNGATGGSSVVGTITTAGVYTAPAAMPSSSGMTIRATAVGSSAFAEVPVTLAGTPPPATSLSAARFLEQSSFGPTPATLSRVQQLGIGAYLDEQFATAETPIPDPATNYMGELQQWMLNNYTTAPDQLRQRVAYALSQVIVTSSNKLIYPDEMLPWLRFLSQHAFGNYRDLLHDVSMSPSMGKYLDLANSTKPGAMGGANENYPRELMQLFTIGLWELNQDGSQVLGANNLPVSTYDQATVRQVALALTGWTYATAPGATPSDTNWEYFGAQMEPRQVNHDTTSKNFLGCSLQAGQSVQQDLDGVINCLMNHHNTAPFIATRLIRSLVTSNPSPAYIQRVADVFAGRQGGGVPGDLKATVRAILLDPEARLDTATATQGRLKEPILQIAGLLRALNGQFSSTNGLVYLFDYMAQQVVTPASVFSWFSPLYRVPSNPIRFGPEFQIYSPTEATLRGNFLYMLLSGSTDDFTIDLSPFQQYGNDMTNLVEAANQVLLYGRMPQGMKQAIITAAAPGYDAQTRIQTVLYLTALSGQYAIQH